MALQLLDALRGRRSGSPIDDFDHCLQTATRAERAGAGADVIVAALLHDVGKTITNRHHDRVAAEILAGSVSPGIVWAVGVHRDFTSRELPNGVHRHARYRHVLHPHYRLAKRFVEEWDLPSRDPDYPTLPIEHFAPMVHDVLGQRVRPAFARRVVRRVKRKVRRTLSR